MHITNCNFYITCNDDIDKLINKLTELDNKLIENNNVSIISTHTPIINLTNSNRCILKDNKGEVTSEYGFTYDKLSKILQSGNYSKYIKDGDWIELTTLDGATYKMYANIDTYYGEGEDEAHKIGHHIDFISDDLIYGSTSITDRTDDCDNSVHSPWRMNNVINYSQYGINNGVSTETSPFLANSTKHRGIEGGIIDKLNDYYINNIPKTLKNHIVKKYHKVPTRYRDRAVLTYDNGSKWAEMPYLWLPYEREIHGTNIYATAKYDESSYESHMKQYHSFASINNFKAKVDKKNTTLWHFWWTASTYYGHIAYFCSVDSDGSPVYSGARDWKRGCPICFRFQ